MLGTILLLCLTLRREMHCQALESRTLFNFMPGSVSAPASQFATILPGGAIAAVNYPNLTVAGNPVALSYSVDYVTSGDINGDSYLDLVTVGFSGNCVGVLLGNGSGITSNPPIVTTVASGPRACAVGDFNADGKLDLAIAYSFSNQLTILLGNGDGLFVQTQTGTPAAPTDVAVGNTGPCYASYFADTITFDGATTQLPSGFSPVSIATTDLDLDGSKDWITVGNGLRTSLGQSISGSGLNHVVVTGSSVIVTGTSSVYVYRVIAGQLSLESTFAAQTDIRSCAIGDLNGDGQADIFECAQGATASVLYAALQGDANNDGRVDIWDLRALASHFNQSGATWAWGDFDGNGVVNSADLGILARHWGFSSAPTILLASAKWSAPARLAVLR